MENTNDKPAPAAGAASIRHDATYYGLLMDLVRLVKDDKPILGAVEKLAAYLDQWGRAGGDRAAVIEEAAKLADEWAAARVPDGGGNALRNYAAALRAGAALAKRTPASSTAVPGAGGKPLVFMDQLPAGAAGEAWIAKHVDPSTGQRLEYSDSSGAAIPRVQWCMLFDSYERVVAGYLLTRDLKNWTQLTLIGPAADQPMEEAAAQADDGESERYLTSLDVRNTVDDDAAPAAQPTPQHQAEIKERREQGYLVGPNEQKPVKVEIRPPRGDCWSQISFQAARAFAKDGYCVRYLYEGPAPAADDALDTEGQ